MTIERILPAQELLKDPNVGFSRVLKHNFSKKNYLNRWVKCFIIITKGILYVYSSTESTKPYMIVLLGIFQEIEKVKNAMESPTWVFHLHPHPELQTMPQLDFGTEVLSDVDICVNVIIEHMVISKKMYFSAKQAMDFRNFTLTANNKGSSQRALFQIPPEGEVTLNSSIFGYYDFAYQNPLNLKNIIFSGTSEAAYKELFHNFYLGSFLVRQNDDRQVLTVQSKDKVLKYVLNTNPETKLISVNKQKMEFDNLQCLLSYYQEFDLPWEKLKLTIPYKLVDRDEWL